MKKVIVYTFLISLPAFSGCNKFLEKEPDNRTTVTSPDQVTQLLVTAYPKANYISFCEAMSDNAEDKGKGGADPESDKVNRDSYFFQDVTSKDLDSPEFYFHACYKAIAAANQALEVINSAADPSAFNAQKGEALVARAYSHFMLVTLFSKVYDPATAATDPGIPYVLTPEKEVFGKYERKTVQYVYDMIEKDLTEGVPLVEDKIYDNAPKFHFTQKAAHAFAARFYLFKRNYAKVIEHANLAISGNVADNLRPWNTTYVNLEYFELQAAYTKAEERANILLQEANSLWGRSYASYRFGLYNGVYSNVLNGPNPTGGSLAIGYKVYGADPTVYNVPKFYEHFVYASATANFGDPYNTIPLFTAEEVIFNRAEANVMLGNTNAALNDLNAWVSRNILNYDPGIHNLTAAKVQSFYGGSLQSAMLQTVLHFKRAFYIHEGMRWFDILRLKIPVVHKTIDGQTLTLTADDNRRVLQLPSEATLSGVPLNPR
jgi:hypothetical protein